MRILGNDVRINKNNKFLGSAERNIIIIEVRSICQHNFWNNRILKELRLEQIQGLLYRIM